MNIMLQHSSLKQTFEGDICIIDNAVISRALEGITRLIREGRDILGGAYYEMFGNDEPDEPEGESG